MFGKKKDTAKIEQAVAGAVDYEVTIASQARRSERRAWIVAWCAIALSLILAGGYFLFLPLKEKVPYLVMADPYTGTATVARLGNFNDQTITTSEAINKSNVAQFVLARESYDSGLVGQRNWRTTLSMAGPAVSPAYTNLHSERNPERPYRIYGTGRAIRVRILSIVLIGGEQGQRPKGATVRFQRSIYDKTRATSTPLDTKIATMEFTYNPDLRLNEEDRLLNPLGFRVTNYRVDDDFSGAPVPGESAAPASAQPGVPGAAAPAGAPSVPATDPAVAPAPGADGQPPASDSPADAFPESPFPEEPPAAAPATGVSTR
ncbi:type IV secretion system protein [Luteimonas sp. Y-2-2-4F]|nr:type IV secretion system protein [Luteimonas sp. Y-2-2-4F]MCD9031548.1 type IV secretion system protein [Luteimonas sp. Y-2-2-4F]